jgi:hypothetical protein
MAIGTGEQMQAGNTNPFPIDTDKPLNQILSFVLGIEPETATDADKRRLGVWYCVEVGAIFALPFIYLKSWLFFAMIILHPLLISVYRYLPAIQVGNELDLRWRIFKEALFFGLYTSLFMAVI